MVMAVLFMVSCNTDNDMECPETIKGPLNDVETEFLGSWRFIAMEAEDPVDVTDDDIDNASKDIYAQYTDCERDWIYEFKNDRDYTYKLGYSLEDCKSRYDLVGTWSLSTENSLTFIDNCASETVQIKKSETDNTFSYESLMNFKDAVGNMKTTIVTFTYKRVESEITPI